MDPACSGKYRLDNRLHIHRLLEARHALVDWWDHRDVVAQAAKPRSPGQAYQTGLSLRICFTQSFIR
jgi:hypothetical protein